MALATAKNGDLLVAGDFVTVDSNTAIGGMARWNGSGWAGVGGLDTLNVRAVVEASDGKIWVGGNFSAATIPLVPFAPGVMIFDGSTWHSPGVNPSGSPLARAVIEGRDGTIYTGFDTSGAGDVPGSATISYTGTAPAYPVITIPVGALDINARLWQITNTLNGAVLKFSYAAIPGETITIDTRPGAEFITSDFFGPIPYALIAGSDVTEFALIPANEKAETSGAATTRSNTIVIYMFAASSTTAAEIVYRDTYRSAD